MAQFLFTIGVVIVVLNGIAILFAMVLPRSPRGLERPTLWLMRIVGTMITGVSRVFASFEAKDAVLSTIGPLVIVVQLVAWGTISVIGFAFMLYPTTHNLTKSFMQAPVAMFTIGTVHQGGPSNVAIDIIAGASWVVVVALLLSYLPTLYGAFNRREALVALLESRAGAPAWGPELLARHQLVGIVDTLPQFYASWEQWSADVAETHTTYPALLWFRSPEPWLSWLVGLLAVLDGAAMHLALAPRSAPSEARLCLRMGFTALQRIARTLGWLVNPDPDPNGPITLPFEEFDRAVHMLADTGFPIERNATDAWPDFVGWRVNYEAIVYRLIVDVTAPPAAWSGSGRHLRTESVPPVRPPQRSPSISSAPRRALQSLRRTRDDTADTSGIDLDDHSREDLVDE